MTARHGFAAGLILAVIAVSLRLRNAWRYGIDMGFDAQGNWQYVELLRTTWTLPDPAVAWSAAHPPLFYVMSAGISALLGHPDKATVVVATRLVSTVVGLLAIAAIVHLVRTLAPDDPVRGWLAAALVLFLPVHVYMSAMLSEEILVSSITTFVVLGIVLDTRSARRSPRRLLVAAGLGGLAGLALLTKLSGALIIASGGLAYLVSGWASGWMSGRGPGSMAARTGWAMSRAAAFGAGAALTGGWFYALRLARYGYLYPSGLNVHRLMFEMPPGERSILDYVTFSPAALLGPDLLSPGLIHSVWGSTYGTIWFDGHRHFLPTDAPGLGLAGALIGILAIVPTAAFLYGAGRALRRVARAPNTTDVLLLALVVSTLAGYVFFTWRNPWFATVKGSFLLGLAAPFGCYASEALAIWGRAARRVGTPLFVGLIVVLGLLWVAVVITYAYDGVFTKREYPGIRWRGFETSGAGSASSMTVDVIPAGSTSSERPFSPPFPALAPRD